MPPTTSHPNGHPSPSPSTSTIYSDLQEKGYAILPALLPASTLPRLRLAASRLTAAARAGEWPYIRTLPKQFPPWGDSPGEAGIWGVQHLLHPDLPDEERDAFAGVYFAGGVLAGCEAAMGLEPGAGEGEGGGLVMELFNLLVTPDRDFELRWHRDDVGFDGVSRAEEAEALGVRVEGGGGEGRKAWHAQYNIPLFPDSSLQVVPGSHRRARTAEEERVLAEDGCAEALPGMVAVQLAPGDAVFYDNNIIHRGVYKSGVERLTLHGSVGDARGGGKRARNVLQHGVGEWVERCEFGGLEEEGARRRAEGMRRRLVEMGRGSGLVGFSHDD